MDPVEAILGPRPYNDPPAWPESTPADAELAELFNALRKGDHTVFRTKAPQLAEAPSAAREKVVLDTIKKLVEGWKDGFYDGPAYSAHASNPDVHAEYNRWYMAMIRRSGELEILLAVLGPRPSDDAMKGLDAIRARSSSFATNEKLGSFLLGQRNNDLDDPAFAAPRAVLENIASALTPKNRAFSHAVRAVYLLEGSIGLRDRVVPLLENAKDDAERRHIMTAVCGAGIQRLITADASWVDRAAALFSDPAGINWHLQQLNRLDLWLRALRFPMCARVFDGVTRAIKAIDDVSATPALRELAATLPRVPTAQDARAKPNVDRVIRFLERDRKKKLPKPPKRKDGLGTDGGPILLLTPTAAKAWKGSPKDYGEPTCDPNNDYDRACDAPNGDRIAAIDVGGEKAIVLPEQGCELATVKPHTWIIIRGDDDDIVWNALGPEAVPFESIGTKLTVGADGLILLDAAYPGAKPKGRKKALKLAAGEYDVEELYLNDDRGSLHLVRLSAR